MDEQLIYKDINDLIHRTNDLINYYKKYEVYFVHPAENGDPFTFKNNYRPTQRVVSISDYISEYVDMINALSKLDNLNNDNVSNFIDIIKQLCAELENIINKYISKSLLLKQLDDHLHDYGENVKGIGEDDYLYFELAFGQREIIEKIMYMLNSYFNINENNVALSEYIDKLKIIDDKFKKAIIHLRNNLPNNQRPYPYRYFYTPEVYWWYI